MCSSDLYTGGSKDTLDPFDATTGQTGWNWTTRQTPDKNDLTDVFARVKGDNLYLGALRDSTDGTAYLGFWLYRRAIAANLKWAYCPWGRCPAPRRRHRPRS